MADITGTIKEIVFRNEETGYSVVALRSGNASVTAVGVMPPFQAGERIKLTGEWTVHRQYGKQFRIETCEELRITTLHGIERYLGSGSIKGVGPSTAKLIVQHFGKQTLEILDESPGRLTEIPGIGPKRAAMIAESYHANRATRSTMIFLGSYGITPMMANRILKKLGENTETLVRADPYILIENIEGIGFITADRMALSLGIARESEHRVDCGILYCLQDAAHQGGHVYLPLSELVALAGKLLSVPQNLVETRLRALALNGSIVLHTSGDEVRCYLPEMERAEAETARILIGLMKSARPLRDDNAQKILESYQSQTGLHLSGAQVEALHSLSKSGVLIVTGGPGTGKTTCLKCLMKLLETAGTVLLCAPTGRAARRMSETTDHEAKTIHRLLEYSGEEGDFLKNASNPLRCAAVIVDEMSMVDIFLMRRLLIALNPGTRLVLVGDADQLPSVGAGNVLRDLIHSAVIPVVRLTQIFRQAETSMIPTNAQRINQGKFPLLNRKGSDCFIERCSSVSQAVERALSLCTSRLPAYLDVDAQSGIQLMSPMKKGDSGVWELNQRLQAQLNPPSADKDELEWGERLLRVGDKVMQMRNNYNLSWTQGEETGTGVFNGDIGFVDSILSENKALRVRFDCNRIALYEEDDLNDLELAYCITVHKSQGSEFEAVVLMTTGGPPMLFTRNLLYTAVTRAKRLLVIVGQEDVLRRMVENNHITRRYTSLTERLSTMRGLMTGSQATGEQIIF